MREIKFRAWDTKEKRMWWNVQDAYDTGGSHHTSDPDADKNDNGNDEFTPDSFGSVLDDADYIVMQFTGLKDKNGKEIYEGDILKARRNDINCWYGNLQVRFDGEFSFCLRPYCYGWLDWYCLDKNQTEIVGNIHENPELLK